MRLLLIKAGKAIKTIQRDGILKGGKRVFSAFFALFRKVGSGDILFVTGGVGDSARYRAHHVAEELEMNGFKCSITVQDNPMLSGYVDKFSVFVFHRVLFTPSVQKMIEKIKLAKKEIIFETDDLVYDPKYLVHMDYFKVMNSLEKKLYENGVGGEILADPYVKVCTTTTNFLADKLRENPARNATRSVAGGNKKVFLVPNKLTKKDVEVANKIIGDNLQKIRVDSRVVRIGYFSGTISHNKDFATVTDALMQIMERHQKLELFLVGPLDLENTLSKYKDRIKQLPYVVREKHFANIASVDINIVPLEIENPFCQSKSQIKFFEAGIVGVPTVAAATGPHLDVIEDGVDGFVANGTQQWTQKLEKLILDEKLRKQMGQKAREKVLRDYTTISAKNEEYYEYLKSKIV